MVHIRKNIAVVALTLFITAPAYALIETSGDFVEYVQYLETLILPEFSKLYDVPTSQDLAAFYTLACTLYDGKIPQADIQAAAMDYDLIQFKDTSNRHVYYGLCERLVNGSPSHGWGSYFINFTSSHNALVELPHPVSDINTPQIGAAIFRTVRAKGLLMAGAHRNCNGTGRADVAHLAESIFQEVHKAWSLADPSMSAWQIHGFSMTRHPDYPPGSDVVLSTGNGQHVNTSVLQLDYRFAQRGFLCYVFNDFDVNDPLNIIVNETWPGPLFVDLDAQTNVQGIFSNSLGQTFTHIELEENIRFNQNNRTPAVQIIADVIAMPKRGDIAGYDGFGKSDGKINMYDMNALAANWSNQTSEGQSYNIADITRDRIVDTNDLTELVNHWFGGVCLALPKGGDIAGALGFGIPDGKVDLYDWDAFAAGWLHETLADYSYDWADITGDRIVDANDLMILIDQWLQQDEAVQGDITGPQALGKPDGKVDMFDLSEFSADWLHQTYEGQYHDPADITGDRFVNANDLVIFITHWFDGIALND